MGGKGKVLLRRTHSPDRQTVVAVAAVHALEVRKEAKDPRAARVVRVERTRPVEAAAPGEVERTVPTIAGDGQEKTVAVLSGE